MKILLTAIFCFATTSLASAKSTCLITMYDHVESVLKNCTNVVIDNLEVPAGQTLNIQPLPNTVITIKGNITFGYQAWAGPLIQINATGLKMVGEIGSVFHGNGPLYWDGLGEWGTLKPHFAFVQAVNSKFANLEFRDSPRYFILISDSKNVTFTDILLDNSNGDVSKAGKNHCGHNTDGFDVFNGTDITIEHSEVFNQDDCIAIRHGSNIHVNDLDCHGGHGLSLSVGFSNTSVEENTLSNVVIENSVLYAGDNGIHIKTHVDAGKGLISNVTYRNIIFHDISKNGIIIQQNYKNLPGGGPTQIINATDNIPIKGLILKDVFGSVAGEAKGVSITCAEGACLDWEWEDVTIPNSKNECNFDPPGFKC